MQALLLSLGFELLTARIVVQHSAFWAILLYKRTLDGTNKFISITLVIWSMIFFLYLSWLFFQLERNSFLDWDGYSNLVLPASTLTGRPPEPKPRASNKFPFLECFSFEQKLLEPPPMLKLWKIADLHETEWGCSSWRTSFHIRS